MDRLALSAFEKMQKREHSLRVLRDQMGLGRITREVFRQESLKVIERYKLTDDEERAYDLYNKVTDQRKRN
ncbi:hypothetical protein KP806_07695 [Paenibacillus sp. N4]|uniref:hypothetical protein n=1 Tax=Paenibacillus vietnamensis TaxID=2590547 RepID=UPI001CD12758|nr:hypothetical protein [Paenibacillus vietnamensis]MCA0754930.1 hypothetical protein [Paenibacillus vietnamensis]